MTTDAEFLIAVDSAHHEGRWALPVDEVDAAIDAAIGRCSSPPMEAAITNAVVYAT